MQKIKSIFISLWITLLFVGSGRALWLLMQEPVQSQWIWVLLALLPASLFFIWLFVGTVARTKNLSKTLVLLSAIASVMLLLNENAKPEAFFWTWVVGLAGSALYEWWYSRFGTRDKSLLAEGNTLPALEFIDTNGQVFSTETLQKPMLLIFFRGNWCPLCMAQIKEVAAHYQALADKGVEVMLISSQPQKESESLAKRFETPMTFLIDKDNKMAIRLGIQAENGLPAGMQVLGYASDTVMPTVIMTNHSGQILFADLTDNYRIRPEPEIFLQVFAKAGI